MSTAGHHHDFEQRVTACPHLSTVPAAQLVEERRRERDDRDRQRRRGMRR